MRAIASPLRLFGLLFLALLAAGCGAARDSQPSTESKKPSEPIPAERPSPNTGRGPSEPVVPDSSGIGSKTSPEIKAPVALPKPAPKSAPSLWAKSAPKFRAKSAHKIAAKSDPESEPKIIPEFEPKPAPPEPKSEAFPSEPKSTPAFPESEFDKAFRVEPLEKTPTAKSVEVPTESMPKETQFSKTEAEPEEAGEYTVVKVFYGTDRLPVGVSQWEQSLRCGYPYAAIWLLVIAGATFLWSLRSMHHTAWRVVAGVAGVAGVVVGSWTLYTKYAPELFPRRIERMYGDGRGELEMGVCEVSIPKDHRLGELESPTVMHLEVRQDPERHVVLMGVWSCSPEQFYTSLRECIGRSGGKQAFVFIHGYNVGFETAARRTAQIAYDLKFDGAPIFYSWPSREGLLSYTVDETNVAWTVPHLKDFLTGVARRTGAESVHLVAHSMGNRALTSALRELTTELRGDCPRFSQVILAAPDIDADVFRRDLAPAIVKAAQRVTLYASSNDEALVLSKKVHGYPRAGETGDGVVVVPDIDTVDVSSVDTSFIGHSYYGSNDTVLADLFELIHGSKPPDQRRWLRAMQRESLRFWKFVHEKLAPGRAPGEEL